MSQADCRGKDGLRELLRLQFRSLDHLGSNLTSREWHANASLPGWMVLDVFAHIIGTESMLEGDPLPDVTSDVAAFSHVHNEIGCINETWVEALSLLDSTEIMARFRSITARRLQSLAAMSEEELEAETPTPVGPAPYWRFMQLRVFDCWMHEQDIREALGRPGHDRGPCAEAAVDEVERNLAYLIGQRADVRDGSSLTLILTGPVQRMWWVAVEDGRARLVHHRRPPMTTSTVTMGSSLFMRLVGGRTGQLAERLGEMEFDGDLLLARQIVTNLTLTV